MLPGLVSPLVTDAVDSHFSFVSQRFDSSRHSGTLHPAERRSEIINELHFSSRLHLLSYDGRDAQTHVESGLVKSRHPSDAETQNEASQGDGNDLPSDYF